MTRSNLTGADGSRWDAFVAECTTSQQFFKRALELLPGGVSHNNRKALPFPLYIRRANRARKWDVDGHEFVDYSLASASLLLGHAHPDVMASIGERLAYGTGTTDCHELELEWAECVTQVLPCAERVRFVASGTEATQLAIRLARAATGKNKIARIEGHYFGWHDYGLIGFRPGYPTGASAGIPAAVAATVATVDPNNPLSGLELLLSEDDDIAAIMVEPSGARWGAMPLPHGFLSDVRKLADQTGTLLIFDEVITGFRYAPGGAQERFGVTPDLATLGKILTGGLPGGGIAGRADVLDLLTPWGDVREDYVLHYGTFNANPLTAAAGVATLKALEDGQAQKRADAYTERLRSALNNLINELGILGFVFGESSQYHVYLNAPGSPPLQPDDEGDVRRFLNMDSSLVVALQQELWARGVDPLSYNGGVASSVHGDAELEQTVAAYDGALRYLVLTNRVATLES